MRVHDGDTVLVQTSARKFSVRLAEIDAPELAQPFGPQSRDALRARLMNREVIVVWSKHDKYFRRIGKILLHGEDINLAEVRDGMAWHYKAFAWDQPLEDRTRYARTETRAKAKLRGLWTQTSPEEPWAYRKRTKPAPHTLVPEPPASFLDY